MNNTLIGIFSLLLTALVLQNAVFSRALDITSLLVNSRRQKRASAVWTDFDRYYNSRGFVCGTFESAYQSVGKCSIFASGCLCADFDAAVWNGLLSAELEKTGLVPRPQYAVDNGLF